MTVDKPITKVINHKKPLSNDGSPAYTNWKRISLFETLSLSFSIGQKKVEKLQIKGAIVTVIVWQLDLQLPMQSMPIITDVSSNVDQGEVYTIMW